MPDHTAAPTTTVTFSLRQLVFTGGAIIAALVGLSTLHANLVIPAVMQEVQKEIVDHVDRHEARGNHTKYATREDLAGTKEDIREIRTKVDLILQSIPELRNDLTKLTAQVESVREQIKQQ